MSRNLTLIFLLATVVGVVAGIVLGIEISDAVLS
jgi:hypothetical protein